MRNARITDDPKLGPVELLPGIPTGYALAGERGLKVRVDDQVSPVSACTETRASRDKKGKKRGEKKAREVLPGFHAVAPSGIDATQSLRWTAGGVKDPGTFRAQRALS